MSSTYFVELRRISRQTKDFSSKLCLSSFAIHLRNLIDFFYTQPGDARNDDVVAADFFDPASAWNLGAIPKSLNDARERANKEISHITYRDPADHDRASLGI
ncbi:MAG: hypothetical protein WB616_20095 [Candidatus Sulfotelmatobacter sp.]|jgi:hypothetical protein